LNDREGREEEREREREREREGTRVEERGRQTEFRRRKEECGQEGKIPGTMAGPTLSCPALA